MIWGWNTYKIISRQISLTFPLSADHNITDLLQREHPKLFREYSIVDVKPDGPYVCDLILS